MLPEKFQKIMNFNPIAQLIEGYRSILYYHEIPNIFVLSIWSIAGLILLVIGYCIFKKMEKSFVEEL